MTESLTESKKFLRRAEIAERRVFDVKLRLVMVKINQFCGH